MDNELEELVEHLRKCADRTETLIADQLELLETLPAARIHQPRDARKIEKLSRDELRDMDELLATTEGATEAELVELPGEAREALQRIREARKQLAAAMVAAGVIQA